MVVYITYSPALVGEFDGDIFLASRRRHGGILLGSKWMCEDPASAFTKDCILFMMIAYILPAFFRVLRTDCCNNNNILEQEGALLTGKVDYMFDVSETWWLAWRRTSTQSIVLMTVLVMSDNFERKRIKLADPSIEYLQVLVNSSNVNVGLISAARLQIASVEPLFGPAASSKLQAVRTIGVAFNLDADEERLVICMDACEQSRQFCLVDSTLRTI
ncbi:hypothetical protein EV424DRAFT_1347287 [Suillus variegatus]|nr:hypothetical protein EV424DRAFT_1347287 [Suillus variegatus]